MKATALKEKLQHTYQAMLEMIEVLVNKEGKTLNEALEHVNEKLSELEELSREESLEISEMLKQDLHDFSATLIEAKDAYKEQMKLDVAYITDNLFETFMKIADSNTAQLIEFKNRIEKEAREATTDEHNKEHQEHQTWHAEHALWLDEINFWKKDHEAALAKLHQIEQAIEAHNNALDEHAQVIQSHEALDKSHEQIISEAEQDPTSQLLEEQDQHKETVHQKTKEEHSKHAQLHNMMKKDHLQMMALVNRLHKAVVEKHDTVS